MKYKIYESSIDSAIQRLKKGGGLKKDMPLRQAVDAAIKICVSGSASFDQAMHEQTSRMFVFERPYEINGRRVLFPESDKFIPDLVNAKFSFGDGEMPKLPWKAFSVAIPKNQEVDGVEIPPFMVCCKPAIEVLTDVVLLKDRPLEYKDKDLREEFQRDLKTEWENSAEIPSGERFSMGLAARQGDDIIAIMPSGQPGGVDLGVPSMAFRASDMKKILELTPEELESCPDIMMRLSLSRYETPKVAKAQAILMRLAAGLAVHFRAMGVDAFRGGLPSGFSRPIKGMPSIKPLALQESDLGYSSGKSIHIRRAHYRQLNHPRWYTGEWADADPGSRWVRVKESLVNAKPSTANEGPSF